MYMYKSLSLSIYIYIYTYTHNDVILSMLFIVSCYMLKPLAYDSSFRCEVPARSACVSIAYTCIYIYIYGYTVCA